MLRPPDGRGRHRRHGERRHPTRGGSRGPDRLPTRPARWTVAPPGRRRRHAPDPSVSGAHPCPIHAGSGRPSSPETRPEERPWPNLTTSPSRTPSTPPWPIHAGCSSRQRHASSARPWGPSRDRRHLRHVPGPRSSIERVGTTERWPSVQPTGRPGARPTLPSPPSRRRRAARQWPRRRCGGAKRDEDPRRGPRAVEKSGGVLLSQGVYSQVPSALVGLTSVFGMGTGVTPPP